MLNTQIHLSGMRPDGIEGDATSHSSIDRWLLGKVYCRLGMQSGYVQKKLLAPIENYESSSRIPDVIR